MDSFKSEILVKKLQDLRSKDSTLDQAFCLIDLDYEYPNLFNLLNEFDKEKVKYSIDVKKIKKDLEMMLLDDMIELYQCLAGEKFLSTSKWSVIHLIKDKIQNFKEECKVNDDLDFQIENLKKQIKKVSSVGTEYLNYVKKNTQEFDIDFKLEYDKVTSNALCCKAQAYLFKKRHEEIESITKHYGRPDIIASLEKKRTILENENRALKIELKDCQELLKKYKVLDPELVKEYKKIKEELNCRKWACRISDRSSSSSIGSFAN